MITVYFIGEYVTIYIAAITHQKKYALLYSEYFKVCILVTYLLFSSSFNTVKVYKTILCFLYVLGLFFKISVV